MSTFEAKILADALNAIAEAIRYHADMVSDIGPALRDIHKVMWDKS